MTTPEPTTEIRNADLAAIDDALAAGAPTLDDPVRRELQELALALRADTPEAESSFAASLDALVADRFGARADASPRRSRLRRLGSGLARGRRLAVAGTAASLLLAALVTVSLVGRGGEGQDADEALEGTRSGGGSAEIQPLEDPTAAAAPEDAIEPSGAAERRARALAPGEGTNLVIAPGTVLPPEPPMDGGIAPRERNRRIERSASLTLAAPGDELDSVGDRIVAVVDRRGGFVLNSSLTTGDEGVTGGSYDLRVPARSLRATLRELSGLATVRARTQSGQDVTRNYVSVEDRLRSAEASRRGLLRRLERAQTDREADALRRRIDLASGQINGLRGQLRNLRERTTYAALDVQLVEKDGKEGGGSTGAGGTREALDDALDSLLGSLNLALRVLGVLVPLTLFGAAAWLAAGLLRRRRREAALS